MANGSHAGELPHSRIDRQAEQGLGLPGETLEGPQRVEVSSMECNTPPSRDGPQQIPHTRRSAARPSSHSGTMPQSTDHHSLRLRKEAHRDHDNTGKVQNGHILEKPQCSTMWDTMWTGLPAGGDAIQNGILATRSREQKIRDALFGRR